MAINGYSGVQVFSETKAKERELLGARVTEWISQSRARHPNFRIIDTVVSLSSDEAFHCLAISVFFSIEAK